MSSSVGFNDGIDCIRTRREQFQLTAFRTQLIFPSEDKSADLAAFAVVFAAFFLFVYHTVTKFSIVPAEIVEFADEILFRNGGNGVFSLFGDADKAVEFIAEYRIIAFDFGSDVSVFAVPADLDIVECRLLAVDLVKVFDLGAARIKFTVLIDEFLQIIHCVVIEMSKIFTQLLHQIEDLAQFPLVFFNIEPADPADRQGQQLVDILIGDITLEQGTERSKSGMDLFIFLLFAAALFDALIDAVFKEKLCQRFGMEQFGLTVILILKLKIEIFQQFFRVADYYIMDRHLSRFAVAYHGHIHRNRNGAIGVHVKRLKCFFRIGPAHRHHSYFHVFSSVIIDTGNSYFIFLSRFFDGCHQTFSSGGRRDLPDHQLSAVDLDLGTQNDLAVAVIVFSGIHESALLEIRIKLKRFSAQCGDLCLKQFIEVVRHDLCCHTHGDTVAAEHEQRRYLYRQHHRLLTSSVV